VLPQLGPAELIIILLIIVIIFGAGRLPEVGRAIGQGIRGFQEDIKPEEETKRQSAQQKDQETGVEKKEG